MLSKIIKKIKAQKQHCAQTDTFRLKCMDVFWLSIDLINFKWTLNFMSIGYEKKDQGVFSPLTS